jgi:hypothetical protein
MHGQTQIKFTVLYVHCNVGSSWFAAVCPATTNSNGGFENGNQEYRKTVTVGKNGQQIPDVTLNKRANQR